MLMMTACHSSKKVMEMDLTEETLLDTLVVSAPKPVIEEVPQPIYQASAERLIDLKHMDLEISFNWEKEQVFGNAILRLSPYFYPTNEIVLDAYNMDVKDLSLNGALPLNYTNQYGQLIIKLDRTYSRDEDILLHIQYVANPSLGQVVEAGRQSDLGLYFINSDQSNPEKPMQIWSQGETQYNSRWFPTVDQPNERYTHDIKITVADRFATLSNGYLVSSNKYDKLTRTDHWRMDDEHAPYLTMIAVGEFAVVNDQWNGKPLMYFVEKDYEAYAQKIFNHTPEMLTYFSDLTGVAYPWDKYAQMVVRDFVAGAMENTTAVTFGEFVQKTDVELIDNHNDDIVAHELFHHWFGDYVTCESWANLTLNEAFANYSEYLWTDFKYGQEEADYKRRQELYGYLYQAKNQGTHPLIDYHYSDKENMFDAHSYNKGGLVLHMLRAEIGDDAFFAGMQKYLKDNAGSAVEVDELRMAYEEVTGRDLQVFFNQWFLSSGHPELNIQYTIEADKVIIDVEQVQSLESSIAVFDIPLEFDIYDINGKVVRQAVRMTKRKQSYELSSMGRDIDWINFDPAHTLLAEFQENKTKEDYIKELNHAKRQYDQNEALEKLAEEEVDIQLYKDLMISDKHYWIKWQASRKVPYSSKDKDLFEKAIAQAKNSYYKGRLISKLKQHTADFGADYFSDIIESNKSWNIIAPSLINLSMLDMDRTMGYIDQWKAVDNTRLIFAIASIISKNNAFDRFDYICSKIGSLSPRALGNYTKIMNDMLMASSSVRFESMLQQIQSIIMENDQWSTTKKAIVANKLIELERRLDEEKKSIFRKIMQEE